ncbi:hypothetical protein [Acetobacter vaccinii]|uniref:Uncharacterized protein n=1 Tax=Acetobacter vaccinii TaxID=2592655 RepID=A0A5C1YLP2_9PROT|nr:hypothetical protein [Acetobacter vaccinii]QEO16913.1 hypothetical protein FLP30_03395 [Acetobacter vaccinii]
MNDRIRLIAPALSRIWLTTPTTPAACPWQHAASTAIPSTGPEQTLPSLNPRFHNALQTLPIVGN